MRTMRRFKQLLPEEMNYEILEKGTHGVLALIGDDDYPYAVPLNYYYDKESNKIYFHGASAGARYDSMLKGGKCSFCVVDLDENDEEHYSTFFRSVICFGKSRVLDDANEIAYAIGKLTRKYVHCFTDEQIDAQIELEMKTCKITAVDVDIITGKEAIELVRERVK